MWTNELSIDQTEEKKTTNNNIFGPEYEYRYPHKYTWLQGEKQAKYAIKDSIPINEKYIKKKGRKSFYVQIDPDIILPIPLFAISIAVQLLSQEMKLSQLCRSMTGNEKFHFA